MNFAFMLFSPDCILSANLERSLQLLECERVRIASYRWHQLSSKDVDALYAANRASRRKTLLDALVEDLFSLSKSLCCIVIGPDTLSVDELHRRLLALKGPSDPFKCGPRQMRRALGATNRILNLFHTSDRGADSLRESAIFFPSVSIESAKGIAISELTKQVGPLSIMPVSISGFSVVHQIKGRVLDRGGSRTALLDPILAQMEHERDLLSSTADHVILFEELRQLAAQQRRSFLNSALLPDEKDLLCRLLDIEVRSVRHAGGEEGDRLSVITLLERSGFALSRWERLMLAAEETMSFHARGAYT